MRSNPTAFKNAVELIPYSRPTLSIRDDGASSCSGGGQTGHSRNTPATYPLDRRHPLSLTDTKPLE